MKEAAKTEAAFSCVTEVEQHPQREEEPHNRNSEPPAILLCHESPAELCLSYGNDRLSVSGELCGTARSKRERVVRHQSRRPDSFPALRPQTRNPRIKPAPRGSLDPAKGYLAPSKILEPSNK
jgi:hypothetical protein